MGQLLLLLLSLLLLLLLLFSHYIHLPVPSSFNDSYKVTGKR